MALPMIEDDTGRPSDLPDDEGRPSCVVVLPAPRPPCVVCGRMGSKRRRRGACIACGEKLRQTGNPLPPRGRDGPRPHDPLVHLVDRVSPERLVDRMTDEQRRRLRAYLGELAPPAPKP